MSVAASLGRRAGTAGITLHSRICAAVTAASCLAHLWLVAGNQHGTWLNLLMLAMVAVCLPCAVHICATDATAICAWPAPFAGSWPRHWR